MKRSVEFGVNLFLLAGILACEPGQSTNKVPTPQHAAVATNAPKVEATATAQPEILNPDYVSGLETDVLKLSDYTSNFIGKMKNFWLNGQLGVVNYTRNGKNYMLNYTKAQPNPTLRNLAHTGIVFGRSDVEPGRQGIVFYLTGEYQPSLGNSVSAEARRQLNEMNYQHEALVSIATINGDISLAERLGVDFGYPTVQKPDENDNLLTVKKYIPTIRYLGEAVAELNDYILTYPLLDKDPQTGKIIWARSRNNPQDVFPLVEGTAFIEGGITYIQDQTIGPALAGIRSWDELTKKYPRLQDIPGFEEYLKRMQANYAKN